LPLIRETLDALCDAKIYTKLDIIAAFNKLRIAEGYEWKTAFITRFGLYESLVMPFGLCNAPASFQNYINHTLHDLLDRVCTAYLDDVLVYSKNQKEHREHVREVVQRLAEAGLQIDIKKCEFEVTKTKYLGIIVTPTGIQMDPEKVRAIQDWLPPPCLKDLQRFIGFANFYQRFIRNFSGICKPLNDLMRKEQAWEWGEAQQNAFLQLKHAFATAPILATYNYHRRTVLETDASDWASGGVLSQYDDNGNLCPVAYFSSRHSATECNYEIYDKELLAIIKAMEEWRPELQGADLPTEILTDHKNLEYFTTTKILSQRQVRWSEFLSQFNFRIIYRPGARAIRPDALSRKPGDRPDKADQSDDRLNNRHRTMLPKELFDPNALYDIMGDNALTAAPIEVITPAHSESIDDITARVYARSDTAIQLITAIQDPTITKWPKELRKLVRVPMTDCKVHNRKLYYRDRLYAPPDDELRTQLIYRAHNTGPAGHPGRVKTLDLITRSWWWPNMSRDIEQYVKACNMCVRSKASRLAPQGFLQPLPLPYRAWSDISVDYITPLPKSTHYGRTYQHLLVVVCRLTKMRHLIPVTSLNAEELADAFVSRVYCLHGCPDNIVSDRGSQFVSEFWTQLSKRLGVTLKHSSSFHPESDGQTERINSAVEAYLRAFMNFHQDDWVQWLPLAEFAMNNVVSDTTGTSPFYANYGFHPQLGIEPSKPPSGNLSIAQKQQFYRANAVADRFERILTQLKALAQQSIDKYEHYANVHREDAPRYQVGQRVWVDARHMKTNRPMKKGDDKVIGPYKILKVYPRACLVQLPTRVCIFPVFHNSLLRPHTNVPALPGQDAINKAESRNLRGRILTRDDETHEIEERWEFDNVLDCHNEAGLQYLVKWKHHPATWQPAGDLRGQDEVLLRYHAANPDKPGPPRWVKVLEARKMSLDFCFPELLETNSCLEGGYCHGTKSPLSLPYPITPLRLYPTLLPLCA
jgi:transposase InsO family protein